jgi:hypothetical protein
MTVPVVAGGLFLGVLSAVPPISFLNCACCILVIGGGLLASYLYMKDYPLDSPRVTYGDGALLGLLAGLLGAVVDTVVSIPINLMLDFGFSNQDALEQLRNTPDVPPQLIEFLESIMSGGVSVIGILISLLFGSIIFSIFAMVGAMLGVALFGPKGGAQPGSVPPAPGMSPYPTTTPPQAPPQPGPPSQPAPLAPDPDLEPPEQGGSDDKGSGP